MNSEGDVGGKREVLADQLDDAAADRVSEIYGTDAQLTIMRLPEKVKKRLRALKQLQVKTAQLEARFFQEVHKLECDYNHKYLMLNSKREEIVRGVYEPTDEDLYPGDPVSCISGDLAQRLTEEIKTDGPGIPDFWLTIFKNVGMLNDVLQPHDEPILKHLRDIKVELKEQPMGFTLLFYFEPNEYFTNEVLTKDYEMKCAPEEEDPFSFEGPEIFKCTGCKIDWREGKNVTEKKVKKRQKHRSQGAVRIVTKVVQADSFFNFFNPPAFPDDPNVEIDDEAQAVICSDFELGHYIRERIVPHAVLYYTGEALEDEDEYDDESSSESGSHSSVGSTASTATHSNDTEPEKDGEDGADGE